MNTVLDLVRSRMGSFTRAERLIALELMRSYPSAGFETVAEFARRAGTSGPTVLRFVGKLEFRSYPEFQSRLREELVAILQSPLTRFSHLGEGGRDAAPSTGFAGRTVENVRDALARLEGVDLPAVLDLLADERRPLFLIGGRFSKANALWTYQLLRELRDNLKLVDEEPANWAQTLIGMGRRSVLVAFDYRRYQEDIVAFVSAARERGASVVAVTDEWMSPIAAEADHVFTAPVAVPSLFDSTIGSIAQMEALVARLAERLGDRARDRIEAIERMRAEVATARPSRRGDPRSS